MVLDNWVLHTGLPLSLQSRRN